MHRYLAISFCVAVLFALSACASDDSEKIVASSPTAISIVTLRFSEPTSIAEAHCAKHGKKALSRGGVKLGVGVKTMWGFDCVK